MEEQLVIVEMIEAQSRCGDFERIFPVKSTVDNYTKYFTSVRATNLIVQKWLKMKKADQLQAINGFKCRDN